MQALNELLLHLLFHNFNSVDSGSSGFSRPWSGGETEPNIFNDIIEYIIANIKTII